MKQKSAIILIAVTLILMGACTPLSLLNKGKKAAKAVEAYIADDDGLAKDISRVVAAVANDDVLDSCCHVDCNLNRRFQSKHPGN